MWAVFRDFLLGLHWHAFRCRSQIESIVIGKVKYFSSLGLHAVDVVGGNVSLRFSSFEGDPAANSARGFEKLTQPRSDRSRNLAVK